MIKFSLIFQPLFSTKAPCKSRGLKRMTAKAQILPPEPPRLPPEEELLFGFGVRTTLE